MATVQQLEKEIKKLKERNKRVEGDKAWELSYSRKILIVTFTYLAIGVYFWAINIPKPWLNAIVPAAAFLLSTLTMSSFKKAWFRYIHKR